VPQEVPVEETKADNIKDAIKSVIKKSQANDGKQLLRLNNHPKNTLSSYFLETLQKEKKSVCFCVDNTRIDGHLIESTWKSDSLFRCDFNL